MLFHRTKALLSRKKLKHLAFYFNGFCKKGDRCPFQHEPNDASKVPKTAPAISDAPQVENKTSSENSMVSAAPRTFPESNKVALRPSVRSQNNSKGDVNPSDVKTSTENNMVSAAPRTFPESNKPSVRSQNYPKGDVNPSDVKTSTEFNMVSVAKKSLPISTEAALKLSGGSQNKPKDVGLSDYKGQSASPHTSSFESEEAPTPRLDTFVDREGSIQSETAIYTDHSSEEEVDIDLEEDDWLVSSPGFDVLVDDRCPDLVYEDDAEYLMGSERDGRKLNDQFLGYDYEDYAEYAESLHERRIDSYVEFEDDMDDQRFAIRRSSMYVDEKMNPCPNWNKELLPVSLPIDGRRGVDLRTYLEKSRVVDDPRLPFFSERNNLCLNMYPSHEKSRQYGRERYNIGNDKFRQYGRERDGIGNDIFRQYGRERYGIGSEKSSSQYGRERYNNGKLGINKRRFKDQYMKSHPDISKQLQKKTRQTKRPVRSSDISRRSVTKKRVTEGYPVFSGPKTLDQIKQEKQRGTADSCGNSGRLNKKSEDFQGPKPLCEILKDKRKLQSGMDV